MHPLIKAYVEWVALYRWCIFSDEATEADQLRRERAWRHYRDIRDGLHG